MTNATASLLKRWMVIMAVVAGFLGLLALFTVACMLLGAYGPWLAALAVFAFVCFLFAAATQP